MTFMTVKNYTLSSVDPYSIIGVPFGTVKQCSLSVRHSEILQTVTIYLTPDGTIGVILVTVKNYTLSSTDSSWCSRRSIRHSEVLQTVTIYRSLPVQ